MLSVSDEQRQYLDLDGAPLPLIDAEGGRCYMLMAVYCTRGPDGSTVARVPGIPAVAEADQPTEALATLAVLIKKLVDQL